jgi:hypothetical protein
MTNPVFNSLGWRVGFVDEIRFFVRDRPTLQLFGVGVIGVFDEIHLLFTTDPLCNELEIGAS